MGKPKCAFARMPCPETNDPTKAVYCPAWVDAVPEVEKDGSGRVVAEVLYRGCFFRRLPLYMLSVAAGTGQAAASADKAANRAVESQQMIAQLAQSPLALLAGAMSFPGSADFLPEPSPIAALPPNGAEEPGG